MPPLRFTLPLLALVLVVASSAQAIAVEPGRVEYVVTEVNPFATKIKITKRFNDKAAADRHMATVSKAHWVKWRYEGDNEPLRFRRFATEKAAQHFIQNGGASKTSEPLAAALSLETSNVAAEVSMRTETVPALDGRERLLSQAK